MAIIQGNAKQGSTRGFYPKVINGSLRFNDNDSAYLEWIPTSTGDRKNWTLSMWFKRCTFGVNHKLFDAFVDDTNRTFIQFHTDDKLTFFSRESGTNNLSLQTAQVFRDPSAWYHLVAVADFDNATQTERGKIYINGQQVTSFSSTTYPASTSINTMASYASAQHKLAANDDSTGVEGFFDGYLANVHFIDGQALTADDFGEFKSGVWVAKAPSVTYGTNGFYLDFANSADIGNDVSGNGNDWTPNNFTASDVVLDSPTDNYCTWNPLARQTGTVGTSNLPTFSDGNLTAASSANNSGAHGTFLLSSGQWYWEVTLNTNNVVEIGIAYDGSESARDAGVLYYYGGQKRIDGTVTAYGSSYTTGDVIGIALDADANSVTFYKNNVSQGAISYTPLSTDPTPAIWMAGGTSTKVSANFGQLGFTYTPPTGYLALSTANLPDPVIDPAQDATPEDYFNTVLYTGNETARSISVGFQPDFVWIKNRASASYWHQLYDSVRGSLKGLFSNETNAESTYTDTLTAFESNGFALGDDGTFTGSVNQTGVSYVSWNWKAGGTGVSNTNGSITSTVSANTTSGFSIVSYTSPNLTANQTVGHGLNQAPEMLIVKNRDNTYNWDIWHKDLTGNNYGLIFNTNAELVNRWSSTAPTSSVFTTINNFQHNGTDDYIAYCFHSVEGFSKFGSYTGNGSADGPFVYTGFRPALVITKRTDSADNWAIYDSARDGYNVAEKYLYADSSQAETTFSTAKIDFLSNGFKWRGAVNFGNASGGTYIYMAFAENPFKYSNAR